MWSVTSMDRSNQPLRICTAQNNAPAVKTKNKIAKRDRRSSSADIKDWLLVIVEIVNTLQKPHKYKYANVHASWRVDR
jgi:hypothetical protein